MAVNNTGSERRRFRARAERRQIVEETLKPGASVGKSTPAGPVAGKRARALRCRPDSDDECGHVRIRLGRLTPPNVQDLVHIVGGICYSTI